MLTACAGSTPRPDEVRVPLPEPAARLATRCPLPALNEGQDAIAALYQTRGALRTCEGKRRDWQRFYDHVRSRR